MSKGIPQSHLAKIWTIGELRVDGQMWNYHVAILMRERQHGFVVVDPMHDKPLPYTQWIKINRGYGMKGSLSRVRFYITDPRKFLPASGLYDQKEFGHKQFSQFFEDLLPTLVPKRT